MSGNFRILPLEPQGVVIYLFLLIIHGVLFKKIPIFRVLLVNGSNYSTGPNGENTVYYL